MCFEGVEKIGEGVGIKCFGIAFEAVGCASEGLDFIVLDALMEEFDFLRRAF